MKQLSKKREIQATLASVVKRLVDNLDVEKIVLFGSYVKGSPTKDSDLDLFIMLNTRKKGIARYAMVSEILEPRTIPMDIIVKTPAEIRKRERYFDPFIRNITMNGKVLYEKKG
ncbi:MAG: nucleotidyltransferase domain-containing protein [Nitrospirae bacterium]|nr:nucleotidyltransferase domain-containing protein [Nitrospirota bacterium]